MDVGVGVDELLFGIGLPADSVVHSVKGEVSAFNGNNVNMTTAVGYALEGWLLPAFFTTRLSSSNAGDAPANTNTDGCFTRNPFVRFMRTLWTLG